MVTKVTLQDVERFETVKASYWDGIRGFLSFKKHQTGMGFVDVILELKKHMVDPDLGCWMRMFFVDVAPGRAWYVKLDARRWMFWFDSFGRSFNLNVDALRSVSHSHVALSWSIFNVKNGFDADSDCLQLSFAVCTGITALRS